MKESETHLNTEKKKASFKATKWRFVVLVLSVIVLLGRYSGDAIIIVIFSYDNPSALQTQIEKGYNLPKDKKTQLFTLLYSVYSFPNIILPLFGGFLIDRIGVKVGVILFASIITVGQIVFAISSETPNFSVAIVGRFIFGIGGESLNVVQMAIVSTWFEGRELAFAMGFFLTVSRLATVANDWLESTLYESSGGLPFELWIGFAVCLVSVIGAICLSLLEIYAGRKDKSQGHKVIGDEDKVMLSDIKNLNLGFWLSSCSCVLVYMMIFPFIDVGSQYFQNRFGFDSKIGGRLIGIPYLVEQSSILL